MSSCLPTSALELAQEAAYFASKPQSRDAEFSGLSEDTNELRSEVDRVKSKCDKIQMEQDQLRRERDEARAESEKYRMERDEAILQREAETEVCRELRSEVKRLQKALKGEDANADKILKLTIASLQSLRDSFAERLGPGV